VKAVCSPAGQAPRAVVPQACDEDDPAGLDHAGDVVRFKSGPCWADVAFHDDGTMSLVAFDLGPDIEADDAREFVDEIRASPKGLAHGLDDYGPWRGVDEAPAPLPD